MAEFYSVKGSITAKPEKKNPYYFEKWGEFVRLIRYHTMALSSSCRAKNGESAKESINEIRNLLDKLEERL